MPQVAAAAALCRVSLALGRSSATGVLAVQSRDRAGQLVFVDGRLAGASMVGRAGRCLGEVLDGLGAWNCRQHGLALKRGLPESPVGAWLVAEGVTDETSVRQALHAQLRERVFELAQWSEATYRFSPGTPMRGDGLIDPALSVEDATWFTMLRIAQTVPLWRLRADLGDQHLSLTQAGQAFAQLPVLDAGRKAMFDLLQEGVSLDGLSSATTHVASRTRDLWSLKLVGAIAVAPGGSYSLLLKKRRQIERALSAHALLELPARASAAQARRALRRLVRDLHPDRFGRSASSFLKRTSTEVVTALVRAEAQISDG